jgi:two-component system OmpR family response regulator
MVHVAIIEGDDLLRASLLESLANENIKVIGASCAVEFYQKIANQSLDIVVVDINLPDLSGFNIIEYLRENTSMGLVVLTDNDSAENKIKSYQLGADLFITKPVATQELMLACTNLANRIASASNVIVPLKVAVEEKMIEQPCWVLNLEDWRMTAPCGYICDLSSKEMIFVNHLAENLKKVVKRNDLFNALDYPNNHYGNRALESMILRLRKKLSDNEMGQMPIKTVHGIGYVFSSPLKFIE